MVEPYFVLYRLANGIIDSINFPINVMFSAFWFWKRPRFRGKPRMPKTTQNLFLDSGGYQAFTRFSGYPFNVEQYARYVERVKPTFVATMDYPCEKELTLLDSRKDRVKETVNNAVELVDLEATMGFDAEVVPVIQGYLIEDYMHCISLYNEVGLCLEHVAVGSLCKRKNSKEIRDILLAIRYSLPNSKIHAFGLTLSALKDLAIVQSINSFDTQAWLWEIKSNKFQGLPSQLRVLSLLEEYRTKVQSLLESHVGTQTLIPYIQEVEN